MILRKLKIPLFSLILLAIVYAFYFVDPEFKRTAYYDDIKIEYTWQLFDNQRCQSRTGGHCLGNSSHLYAAELIASQEILNADFSRPIKEKKLSSIIRNSELMLKIYKKHTGNYHIQMDSILKYKQHIFRKIMIK